MELTTVATTAGREVLPLYRISIFTGAQKDHYHLCSGDTVGFVRSHSTNLDKAKTVPSLHVAVILLPCGDPEHPNKANLPVVRFALPIARTAQ